jgi:predicted Zn-dependent protease
MAPEVSTAINPALNSPATQALPGYASALQASRRGWVTLPIWCVWVQPPGLDLWSQRWNKAVEISLSKWAQHLQLQRVTNPADAHLRLWRRNPPLKGERASNGRALLSFENVQRGGKAKIEPLVDLLISPGIRQEAIQATSLHELGHGFGLWGHSNNPNDVMAAIPGAKPVIELSPRDRITLSWLYGQPSGFN